MAELSKASDKRGIKFKCLFEKNYLLELRDFRADIEAYRTCTISEKTVCSLARTVAWEPCADGILKCVLLESL